MRRPELATKHRRMVHAVSLAVVHSGARPSSRRHRSVIVCAVHVLTAWSVSGGLRMFGVIGIVHRHVVADVSSHRSSPCRVDPTNPDAERAAADRMMSGVVGGVLRGRKRRAVPQRLVVVELAFITHAGLGGQRVGMGVGAVMRYLHRPAPVQQRRQTAGFEQDCSSLNAVAAAPT